MEPQAFVAALQHVAFDTVFNPYVDRCEIYDHTDAPQRRCAALQTILMAATQKEIDSLWIGRDLGYRGGRRTGLALTDDMHVAEHAARWGVTLDRATVGPMIAERTAAVIWSVIRQISTPIFLWNVFPFHPYDANDPFSNRSHNADERAVGEELLGELIRILRPKRLVAIGNNAVVTANRLAGMMEVVPVRHPSYGGQQDFICQVQSLYGSVSRTRHSQRPLHYPSAK